VKKVLDDVMPAGAPWGGPESVRFLSCFNSMLYAIEHVTGEEPLFCVPGAGLSQARCGGCKNFDWKQKYHEQLYHLYLTLSGLAFLTAWPKAGGRSGLPPV
jgi:hypothetical protein